MHAIVTCKFHEDPTKDEESTLFTSISHSKPMGPISCHSNKNSEAFS